MIDACRSPLQLGADASTFKTEPPHEKVKNSSPEFYMSPVFGENDKMSCCHLALGADPHPHESFFACRKVRMIIFMAFTLFWKRAYSAWPCLPRWKFLLFLLLVPRMFLYRCT